MLKLSVMSYSCANLIHTYVELNAEEYAELWDKEQLSELEFVLRDFETFRDWAKLMGYDVIR